MVSLRVLAELAEVSVATVSKALRNDPSVRPHIRRRIHELASQHHYRPNHAAQGIFTGRSPLVAIIVSQITFDPLQLLVSQLIDQFSERGLTALVYNAHNDPVREAGYIHDAVGFRVSGLLVHPANLEATQKHFQELRQHCIPFVVMSEHVSQVNAPHVRGDDAPPAGQLARHLLNHGHRCIGIVAAELRKSSVSARLDGFLGALKNAGIELSDDLIANGGWTVDEGRRCATALLNRPQNERPTAIFAVSDMLAAGVYQAADGMGLNIPEDLSVVGFDNASFSELLNPALTTVHNHLDYQAHEIVRVLCELMERKSLENIPDELKDVTIPRQPIFRRSVAQAPEEMLMHQPLDYNLNIWGSSPKS